MTMHKSAPLATPNNAPGLVIEFLQFHPIDDLGNHPENHPDGERSRQIDHQHRQIAIPRLLGAEIARHGGTKMRRGRRR